MQITQRILYFNFNGFSYKTSGKDLTTQNKLGHKVWPLNSTGLWTSFDYVTAIYGPCYEYSEYLKEESFITTQLKIKVT